MASCLRGHLPSLATNVITLLTALPRRLSLCLPRLSSLLIFYARGVRTRGSWCFNEVDIFVCVPYILKINFSCRFRRGNRLARLFSFKIWNTAALCYRSFTFPSRLMVCDHFARVHSVEKIKTGRILFCCRLVFDLAARANLLHGHDQLIAVCANVILGSKIG